MKNRSGILEWKKGQRFLFLVFVLFLGSSFTLDAQNRKLSGTVVDELGEVMSGVTVTVVGGSQGTVTDVNGKYSFDIPKIASIRLSFVGYKTQILQVPTNKSIFDVTMQEEVVSLSETVVFALGMRRDEKSVATAFQKIDVGSMTEARDGNFLNMLSGKAAGLQIISNGSPGTSTRVISRGNNSLTGNNQPLYVIDGIPIINEMGESGDLDYGNPANSINPDDIEDLVVLKGANAAALYGSDAANGVILITTKKATRKNGMGVTYSSNLQFNSLMQYPIYQNVYGVGSGGRLHEGYNFYNSSNISYDPSLPWGIPRLTSRSYNQRSFGFPMLGITVQGRNGELKSYSPYPDNVTDLYKSGHVFTNNVSVEKLTDVLSVRLSYKNEQIDDILDKFNVINNNSFNLRTTTKVTDYFNVDANVRYNNEQASNRGYRNASSRNPLYAIAWMPRDITPAEMTPWKNADGTSIVFPGGFNNPYWLLNELTNADEKQWLLADLSLNFDITKQLRLRLKGAVDMNVAQGWNFTNMYTPFDTDGEFQNFSEIYRNDTFEAMLLYNKRWGKNSLSAGLGTWGQSYERKKERSAIYTLLQPDDKTLVNNGGTISAWEEYNSKKKQAVFGTVSYGFRDFLYLEATGRNDWSSALPAHNRSYFYSSAGVSFILTELVKIPKNILSFAKLRTSTASVGNDTGFDRLLDGFNYGNLYLGDMPWYESDNLKKNPNLKPEKTTSQEIGADLRFLDSRINIDATYYTKKTEDQIIEANVSSSSGYERAMYNSGVVKNWGTELSLNFIPVRTRNFEWSATFNWANNKSKVVSLVNDMDYMLFAKHRSTEIRAVVGRSYGTLYGIDWKRDENGNPLVDANGRTIETTDPVLLGDVSPDWFGGWRNAIKFGNFDMSVLIDFKSGGLLWSTTATQAARDGQSLESLGGRDEYLFSNLILGENSNERKGYLEVNHTVNPGANLTDNAVTYYDTGRPGGVRIPNAYYDPETAPYRAGQPSIASISPEDYWSNEKNARLFLYDASFIKLREVVVGYNVPQKLLTRHLPFFRTVRLSAVGRNLALLYQKTPKGLDPEATTSMGNGQGVENGFNVPSMSYGFNLRVTF